MATNSGRRSKGTVNGRSDLVDPPSQGHTGSMRTFLLLGSVLAFAGGAATAPGAVDPASSKATLRLLDRDPVKLRGLSFKAGERVRVTVANGDETAKRIVRAGMTGSFTVTFTTMPATDPCTPLDAAAVGSRGSAAFFKWPQRFSERICPMP